MVGKRVGRNRIEDGRGGAAAGISLVLHLVVGALAGAVLHRPAAVLAEVGAGDPGAIDVGIAESAPSVTDEPEPASVDELDATVALDRAPARMSTPAPSPMRARAPKPHVAIATAQQPAAAPEITTAGSTPVSSAIAAAVAPTTTPAASSGTSSAQQVAQGTTSAIVAAAPNPVRVASASATDAAHPARSTPIFLPPEVATYLRAQDDFPALPASLRHPGARYQAKLEICVAADGRVSDVGFRSDPAPALDSVLQAAVRGWRYRPFLVNGVATPFCHRLIVSYEIG